MNNVGYFFSAGIVGVGTDSLNFPNVPNTKKEMQLYPKIVFRLEQHLLPAKYKAEDFELFAFHPC